MFPLAFFHLKRLLANNAAEVLHYLSEPSKAQTEDAQEV